MVNLVTDFKANKGNSSVKAFNKSTYRKGVSQLAAKANKRLARLEKNNLTDSPAYQKLMEDGKVPKFGVKGKTYNEVQTEMSRLTRFLNSETSTIRGINKNLKNIAKNTGIKYKNIKELKTKASKFFELSNKVEQYLRHVEDMASAVGYNQIWEVINEYTQKAKVDLGDANADIDSLVQGVSEILAEVKSDDDIIETGFGDWVFLD